MKTKINIDDFLVLIEIVYIDYIAYESKNAITSNKMDLKEWMIGQSTFTPTNKFKYQNLKDQAESYKLLNTPFDMKFHFIDDFMVDVYISLCKLERLIKDIEEHIGDNFFLNDEEEMEEDFTVMNITKKLVKKDLVSAKRIFDDLMLNYEFTYCEICGIQRNYLNDLLKESVECENFEKSALIRDKINKVTENFH